VLALGRTPHERVGKRGGAATCHVLWGQALRLSRFVLPFEF
jgi:hypothetical protein